VVFDTNILFSWVGWQGKPYQCVELARTGMIDGITCPEILEELSDKLQIKLHLSLEQSLDWVADLVTFLRLVTITGNLKVITSDPDDNKVLECAVIGGASHIITGDRRHLLPLGTFQGIRILRAADFLAELRVP
jgi:putative PIN family toxin of toxin-antitoxin system